MCVLTPKLATARRLGLLWGVHAVHMRDVRSFEEMVAKSKRMALRHKVALAGSRVILMSAVPFGTPGSTNVLHIVVLSGYYLYFYDVYFNGTSPLSSGLFYLLSLQFLVLLFFFFS